MANSYSYFASYEDWVASLGEDYFAGADPEFCAKAAWDAARCGPKSEPGYIDADYEVWENFLIRWPTDHVLLELDGICLTIGEVLGFVQRLRGATSRPAMEHPNDQLPHPHSND